MKVKLIDYSPAKVIAQGALVSYWDDWSVDNVEDISEKDVELHIPRVLSYGHESILEHLKLTFAVEGCSRVCTHQLVRHRLASYTQASLRYMKIKRPEREEVFHSSNVRWNGPIRVKVEGDWNIEDIFVIPESIKERASLYKKWKDELKRILDLYEESVKEGVPGEDARFIIPQGVKSKIVITMNFREFKHFIGLRMCERAQWEIRELAKKMWDEVYKVEELRPLLKWSKTGPKCIALGYCNEGELMPEGCWKRQRSWWKGVWSNGE